MYKRKDKMFINLCFNDFLFPDERYKFFFLLKVSSLFTIIILFLRCISKIIS